MKINVEAIPAEMRAAPRWICWRRASKPDTNGRFKKPPVDPRTAKPFEKGSGWNTDPTRWVSFEDGIACTQQPGVDGVGFVVGGPWVYVDRDLCVDQDQPSEEAVRLLTEIFSYAEISPSETGVKIIAHATGIKNQDITDPRGKVEVHAEGGFTTITGNHIGGMPTDVRDCTDAIKDLIAGRPNIKYVQSILKRIWPSHGNRHEMALAVGGYLARHGFDVDPIAGSRWAEAAPRRGSHPGALGLPTHRWISQRAYAAFRRFGRSEMGARLSLSRNGFRS